MIIVDRDSFIAWTKGILLMRDSKGRVIVGDKAVHERAVKAMKRGETIGLTVDSVLVSKMKLAPGKGFVEEQDIDALLDRCRPR